MTTLVAVKLTPTELKALDQLIARGYYKTRSHCLRQLLFAELDKHALKREARTAIKLERLGSPMRRARTSAADRAERT